MSLGGRRKDSGTEELFFSVTEAQAADISRAVEAAREAFDSGPWPRLTHAERAGILRAIGAELARRGDDLGQIWPRESGVQATFNAFADLAATFPFEQLGRQGLHEFNQTHVMAVPSAE